MAESGHFVKEGDENGEYDQIEEDDEYRDVDSNNQ